MVEEEERYGLNGEGKYYVDWIMSFFLYPHLAAPSHSNSISLDQNHTLPHLKLIMIHDKPDSKENRLYIIKKLLLWNGK